MVSRFPTQSSGHSHWERRKRRVSKGKTERGVRGMSTGKVGKRKEEKKGKEG